MTKNVSFLYMHNLLSHIKHHNRIELDMLLQMALTSAMLKGIHFTCYFLLWFNRQQVSIWIQVEFCGWLIVCARGGKPFAQMNTRLDLFVFFVHFHTCWWMIIHFVLQWRRFLLRDWVHIILFISFLQFPWFQKKKREKKNSVHLMCFFISFSSQSANNTQCVYYT